MLEVHFGGPTEPAGQIGSLSQLELFPSSADKTAPIINVDEASTAPHLAQDYSLFQQEGKSLTAPVGTTFETTREREEGKKKLSKRGSSFRKKNSLDVANRRLATCKTLTFPC